MTDRYRLHRVGGRYSLRLSPELKGKIVALQMAPSASEPELSRGTWLVLVFAVWSGPDIGQIRVLLDIAEHSQSPLLYAARPFDDRTELVRWCPDARETWSSPVWLVLANGRLLGQIEGVRRSDELRRWYGTLLSGPGVAGEPEL